jgi:hypothetical protein
MAELSKADKAEWGKHRKLVRKAEHSVEILERFIQRKDGLPQSLKEAAQLELNRVNRALQDLKLLRSIYLRGKAA